ncbi:hypothetical protein CJD36_001550 [Flavipsychrobacter stenotrophus]|uniref:Uncharacterized protein n=1 Tax=Flavipsychrobacter stenotrophus TaxID=2077091 RepID=A0A2S7T0Q0_9BACT|nr:hypothetical protein [Flavipsychrobacter stenotrophus]PQJ12461.1 hypothetical protein CJD36_001550 [Flavipsychrobacter stenotrophus]
MKIVRVTYTTNAVYSVTNKANISAVMSELQKMNVPGINYHVCVSSDDKSFTHTAFFKSDEDECILLELPLFKNFQQQLKASMPEVGPKQELLSLVGSSKAIF